MDYSLYEPEDFATDESYLRYYFRSHPEDIGFWEQWIRNHPEKLDAIVAADQLIGFAALHLPEEEYQQELERITRAVDAVTATAGLPLPQPEAAARNRSRRRRSITAGVAVLIILITGFIVYQTPWRTQVLPQQLLSDDMTEMMNTTPHSVKVRLEDSSLVTLEAGARIRYPRHFTGRKRDIYLEGNAGFDVSRDPDRPFYVYCNNLVTHVLGTSFRISTNAALKRVEVAVRSGKVEVYERKASNGVILTPNQKVIYAEDSRQFEASLVDDPLPVINDPGLRDAVEPADSLSVIAPGFSFQAAPLQEVLQLFERVYGITIEVENEHFHNCHFSGDISNMDFNARMEVICQVLHATYEIRGTKILIRGEGCK